MAQSELQTWVTDSISKTINMPANVTVDDVEQAYVLAHELGCKGVTIYRDSSKNVQVLNLPDDKKRTGNTAPPSKYAMDTVKAIVKSNRALNFFIKLLHPKTVIAKNTVNIVMSLNPQVPTGQKELVSAALPPIPASNPPEKEEPEDSAIESTDDVCPVCGAKLVHEGGCETCPNCGWSACTVS